LEFYPKVDLQVAKRRLWLTDLKHFKLYPKTIKDWVVDCKTPRGVWETNGTWRATMMLESEAEDETSAETAAQAREREILLGAKVLPADLRDRYRFGVTEEDIRALELTAPQANKLKEILSYKYAGRAEINQFRIAECLKKWSRKANDTGSSEVQSALLLAFAALCCVVCAACMCVAAHRVMERGGEQLADLDRVCTRMRAVAVLTEKIRYMTDHLKENHKDQRTKRALGITIDKRRALLKHLKKQNASTYYHLLRDLNLRDMVSI
jgi:small subunit ribosomal protein S15